MVSIQPKKLNERGPRRLNLLRATGTIQDSVLGAREIETERGEMGQTVDIFRRRQTHFVLWSPRTTAPPVLVIGQLRDGNPQTLAGRQDFPLTLVSGVSGLWEIAAIDCHLQSGEIYYYWFEVDETRSTATPRPRVQCTDPFAFCVDYRLNAPDHPAGGASQPAAVVQFVNGTLVPSDPPGPTNNGATPLPPEPAIGTLPPNNRLVIYELPTAWTRQKEEGPNERAAGSFRDVIALIERSSGGANFASLEVTQPGASYLTDLGVNALELLPPADSNIFREWGYATSHYFAPDFELGFPYGHSSPTPLADLTELVHACHTHGIRFFDDVVMAFGRDEPYRSIDNPDFYIEDPKADPNDPDAHTSFRRDGKRTIREDFGSTLFRFARPVNTYDPVSGQVGTIFPARQLLLAHLARWMDDFHLDGIRMDSVENVYNWDFIGDFKERARQTYRARATAEGLSASDADARFLVIGEELTLPFELFRQNKLDALWNDAFRARVRAAILGQGVDDDTNFEWTIRQAIDCRNLGFGDGAQAVNYVTSHDVEGFRKERVCTMLRFLPEEERFRRIRLAFVCLMTAVGIPMFLAGEEFADEHDLFDSNGNVSQKGKKQTDPVNFSRREQDPRRKTLSDYVARLVHFRTTHPALSINDTRFLHVDFTPGRRVLVWQRGGDQTSTDPVVVVANFSDFGTPRAPQDPSAEYVVPNWPSTPPGRSWREVSQARPVGPEWISREPIFPWEAKVYTLA
jgi:pullulanase